MATSSARARPGQDCTDRVTIALRVLETTDLHGHIHGYDYFNDRPCPATGFARIATLIEQARAEAPNTLLFDNGDFLQGTPLAQYFGLARSLSAHETHPMIAAMNLAGYDAGTLGNHEFDYGLDYLRQVVGGANFPMVCANMATGLGATPPQDETLLPPWVVLERECRASDGSRQALRVGVIGFLPPQTELWARDALDGKARTRAYLEAARAHLPALHAQGVDLVIALAHTGIAPLPGDLDPESKALEHAALALAELDGIDVLLCGHTHLPFPDPAMAPSPGIDPRRGSLLGKPALSAGRWGSHLGVLDLRLAQDVAGRWRVDGFESELRPIRIGGAPDRPEPLPEAPEVLLAVAEAHRETLGHLRQEVGRLTSPVNSFFSLVAPDPIMSFLAEAQARFARERLADRPEGKLPILSAVAPFKCGGRGGPGYFIDLPAGPLVLANIDDVYVYSNSVTALRVTGAELREWLERAAGIFAQITPGAQDQPLIDPEFPCYNFDMLFGLSYQIDPSQPARYGPDGRLRVPWARRVDDIRLNGAPVRDRQEFILVTNSYRSSGAGHFVAPDHPRVPLGRPVLSRDLLEDTIRASASLAPRPTEVWRFAPLPGTSAIFETSPRAAPCLPLADGPEMQPLGQTAEGFLRMRLFFDAETSAMRTISTQCA